MCPVLQGGFGITMRLPYRSLLITSLIGALPVIAQELPDGPGKEATLQICSNCHNPNILFQHRQGREAWSGTIQKMIVLGAQGTPQQFTAILDYLSRNFGPGGG